MSRLSPELLRFWDEDPDAGYRVESPFTKWWSNVVQRSVNAATDAHYRACVRSLDAALTDTIHATQSDIRSSANGLRNLMRAMELWRECDPRRVPSDPGTFDLEDLDQAILLLAFQFDAVIGTPKWISFFDAWFAERFETIRQVIELGRRPLGVVKGVVEEGEDPELYALDDVRLVLGMLEWFQLEDPGRQLGLDLEKLERSVEELETQLRPVLSNLRSGKAVQPDELAPKSFWWRH